MEVQPPRISSAQVANIASAAVVVLGLLWGATTYVDKLSTKLDHVEERLEKIDVLLKDIDTRGRIDHDRLTELGTEFRTTKLKERPGDH